MPRDTSHPSARRNFLKSGAVLTTAGLGAAAQSGSTLADRPSDSALGAKAGPQHSRALPREVRLVTIAQEGLRANTPARMVDSCIGRMREAARVKPDFICLPEIFPFVNLNRKAPSVAEAAEEGIGKLLQPLADFAADQQCYVIAPTYTRHGENCFNSAVFLSPMGEIVGEYQKIHCTTSEMAQGVVPGPLRPPVIETPFGRIGAQICFDIHWDDGWKHLQQQQVDIIFWPSAFAGGAMVNTRAWQHRCCVVSSTNKDESKICDMTGTQLASTSRWAEWVCATVNLERAFLHTWPYVQRFGEIISKYGHRVRIDTHAAEEWSTIESRDPDLKIADIMTEFDLLTMDEHLQLAESEQDRQRPA